MAQNVGAVRMTETNNDIVAIEEVSVKHSGKFKGRRSVWPGAVALVILVAMAVTGLVYFGLDLNEEVQKKVDATGVKGTKHKGGSGVAINDGRPAKKKVSIEEMNPKKYIDRKCEQPNYVTANNKVYAKYKDGTTQEIFFKGVNWFGMEKSSGVPQGLWDNTKTGSTMYRIGEFLQGNRFNAVRIPLSIENVARNIKPDPALINTDSNSALDASRYLKMISTVVQGLGRFDIAIVLEFHNLSPKEKGLLWYGTSIRDADFKAALKSLAKELCNGLHWNVVGIDLKNAPNDATWGDKDKQTDWKMAAEMFGDYLLKECPKWLVFVQGVVKKRSIAFGKRKLTYRDWDGAGLQGAGNNPIKLKTKNKVVYSPQYYTTSMQPQMYFYKSGKPAGNLIDDFVEFGDADLKGAVDKTMNDMFLYTTKTLKDPVILSSYGGLYGKIDLHKKKTSTRTLELMIKKMADPAAKMSGGFLWAMNPDVLWQYNPADKAKGWNFGLLDSTWRKVNLELLEVLTLMNKRVNFLKCAK